jgi:hypothetical protein
LPLLLVPDTRKEGSTVDPIILILQNDALSVEEKAVLLKALPVAGKVQSTGKAAAPVATTPAMIGTPTEKDYQGAVIFFSPEQVAKGEGYRCRLKDPCDRLFRGSAQKRHHH